MDTGRTDVVKAVRFHHVVLGRLLSAPTSAVTKCHFFSPDFLSQPFLLTTRFHKKMIPFRFETTYYKMLFRCIARWSENGNVGLARSLGAPPKFSCNFQMSRIRLFERAVQLLSFPVRLAIQQPRSQSSKLVVKNRCCGTNFGQKQAVGRVGTLALLFENRS